MSVRVEKNGAVWTVIQSRAEARNAVDPQTAEALVDAPHPMREIDYPLDDRLPPRGPMGPTRLELDKPVIAAVAGPAVAGGFELALWCDLRGKLPAEEAYPIGACEKVVPDGASRGGRRGAGVRNCTFSTGLCTRRQAFRAHAGGARTT